MQSSANTPEEYLENLPKDRKQAMSKLRQTILENLPAGFSEEMSYGAIGYVVPHALFPAGYHCDPKLPLPFISIASQKNFVAVYHLGMYAMPELLAWFAGEYPKHSKTKLDMGKSCIRFKKPELLPFALIGELARKMSAADWIETYSNTLKK